VVGKPGAFVLQTGENLGALLHDVGVGIVNATPHGEELGLTATHYSLTNLLGGYGINWDMYSYDCCKGTASLSLHVWNVTDWNSALFTLYPKGKGNRIREDFYIFQKLKFAENKACCPCETPSSSSTE